MVACPAPLKKNLSRSTLLTRSLSRLIAACHVLRWTRETVSTSESWREVIVSHRIAARARPRCNSRYSTASVTRAPGDFSLPERDRYWSAAAAWLAGWPASPNKMDPFRFFTRGTGWLSSLLFVTWVLLKPRSKKRCRS